jgi:hypothetical protein
LITLDLKTNYLKGTIPTEISSMTALRLLRLAENKLTGRIPALPKPLVKSEDCELSYNDKAENNAFEPIGQNSDQCAACVICTNTPTACCADYC